MNKKRKREAKLKNVVVWQQQLKIKENALKAQCVKEKEMLKGLKIWLKVSYIVVGYLWGWVG
jgi:hypothetical protein